MMKKKELIIVIILAIIGLIGFFIIRYTRSFVTYVKVIDDHDQVLLKVDINEDAVYEIKGAYGLFHLEVKDGKWHAFDVDCPNHNCEKMGWASKDLNYPIICLPNRLWVVLDE